MRTFFFWAIVLGIVLLPFRVVSAEPTCRVQVCNKIERFSLSIWSHMKDSMGETCFEASLPKSEAVAGKVLDSQSRWYQGRSINPTKKSVTRVKKVISCD